MRLRRLGDLSNPALPQAIASAFSTAGWNVTVTAKPVTSSDPCSGQYTGGYTFTAGKTFIVDILQFPSGSAVSACPADRATNQIAQVGQYLVRGTDRASTQLGVTALTSALSSTGTPQDAGATGLDAIFGTTPILGMPPTTLVVGGAVVLGLGYLLLRRRT
ncbi:MAG: hypothetical protein ACYC6M_04965 [Terriglobales bacterium]